MASIILPEDVDSGDEYVWMLQKEEYEKSSMFNPIRHTSNRGNSMSRNYHNLHRHNFNGNETIVIDDDLDYEYRAIRRPTVRAQSQIRDDEQFARQIQEELDRELAYKLESEEHTCNHHKKNNHFGNGANNYYDPYSTVRTQTPTTSPATTPPRFRRSNTANNDRSTGFTKNNNTNQNTRSYRTHSPQSDQIFNDFMLNVNSIFNQRADTARNQSSSYRNVHQLFLPVHEQQHQHQHHNQRNHNDTSNRRFNRFNTSRDFTADDYEALLALDENNRSNKNCLSKHEIADLRPYEYQPTTSNTSEDSKTCTICYDDFKSREKIIALGCFHKFHDKCILEWLKHSRVCPLCKKDAITVN